MTWTLNQESAITFQVPQTCPYGGDVVGLECTSSASCVDLAKGRPVMCIQGTCCAYPFQ